MAAIVVSLKWRLLRAGIRGSSSRALGFALSALAAFGALMIALAAEVALRVAVSAGHLGVQGLETIVVVLGSALTLAWLVVPLVVFGIDETVDPSRFALLPLRGRDLVPGLTGAALIGFPGATTSLVTLGTVITWSVSVPSVIAALICAPIAVLTCVLGSRVLTTAGARALSRRRTRDLTAVLGAVIAASLAVVPTLLITQTRHLAALPGLESLALTPLGWAWAIPGDIAQGEYLPAAVRFVLAVTLVLALANLWARLLDRSFTEQSTGGAPSKRGSRAGLLDRLPQPTGLRPRQALAVTSRSLRYWRRDSRFIALFAPLVMVTVLLTILPRIAETGAPSQIVLVLGPTVAWTMSLTAANDAGFDGSAFAAHLICGVHGVADRAGRVLTWALIAVPLVTVLSVATCLMAGRATLIPSLLGVSLATLLGGLGAGSLLGVLAPFPLPASGQNPFQSNSGGGLNAFLAQIAVGAAAMVSALPAALAMAAYLLGWAPGRWLALPLGLAAGGLVLVVAVALAGRMLEERGPEMLAALSRPV